MQIRVLDRKAFCEAGWRVKSKADRPPIQQRPTFIFKRDTSSGQVKMATKFTPINQSAKPKQIRLVLSSFPGASPSSPPMSPLSPPPSWFNDEDMECPHTPILGSPPMSPLTPPPLWFNNEDMECPHSPLLKESSSSLAPFTDSPLQLKSNQPKRSSLSQLLVGQAWNPSALLLPNIPAHALQQSARPAARKRGSEELGLEEIKRDRKVARHKAKKTKKTSTQDEGTELLTSVSNASGSPQASTVLDIIRMDISEVGSN